MFCPKCGANNHDKAEFCVKCGISFEQYTPASGTMNGESSGSVAARTEISLVGRVIAGCKIEKELGRGGMGVVYLGTHVSLNQKRAVKILPPDFSANKVYLARFFKEAQAVAAMKHPNIVQVHDAGEQDGYHYFVMEFVEGTSVSDRIRNYGAFDWKDAAAVARQVLLAFQAAHSKGVIHRDIKPDNILLDKDGNALVADFGLVKNLDEETSGLTKTGQVMGTPHYMSPEQCLGEGTDQRTDIYSLGATIYSMLTGGPMFKAETPLAMLRKQIDEQPQALSGKAPGVPRQFAEYVHKMLAKKPDDRFQSAGAALEALASIIKELGDGVETGAPVVALSDAPTIRHETPAHTASHGEPTKSQDYKEPESPEPAKKEQEKPRKKNPFILPIVAIIIIAIVAVVVYKLRSGLDSVADEVENASKANEAHYKMLDDNLQNIKNASGNLEVEKARKALEEMKKSKINPLLSRPKIKEAEKLVKDMEARKKKHGLLLLEAKGLLKSSRIPWPLEEKLRLLQEARKMKEDDPEVDRAIRLCKDAIRKEQETAANQTEKEKQAAETYKRLYSEAYDYFQKKEWQKAIDKFTEALKYDDKDKKRIEEMIASIKNTIEFEKIDAQKKREAEKFKRDLETATKKRDWKSLRSLLSGREDLDASQKKLLQRARLEETIPLSKNSSSSIGKYEVTNLQYREFIEAGGYANDKYWSKEGKAWRDKNKITEPAFWKNDKLNGDLQPVVGVSYFEAEAYAHWVGGHIPPDNLWYDAAGDKISSWKRLDGKVQDINTQDLNKGTTVNVGTCKDDRNVSGVCDLMGNVMEWTYTDTAHRLKIGVCGGSWREYLDNVKLDNKRPQYIDPTWREPDVGFRIATKVER